MSLSTLQAELQATLVARKAEIADLISQRKIEMEINKITSPLYEQRELEKVDTSRLDAIIEHITSIYVSDKRKVSQVYGYGITVNKLLTIMRSMMYSKVHEKAELLMMTGLDEQLIEDVIEAFGATAYFSPRQLAIIPEKPMSITRLKELLSIAALDIGLITSVNMSKLNTANIEYQSVSARLRAEESLENTVKYTDDSVLYTE